MWLLRTVAALASFAALASASSEGNLLAAVALLAGGLVLSAVVLRPELGVIALMSTFLITYPAALQGAGRLTINNVLGLLLAAVLIVRTALARRTDLLRNPYLRLAALIALAVAVNQLLVGVPPPLDDYARLDVSGTKLHAAATRVAFLAFFVAFIRTRRHLLTVVAGMGLMVIVTAGNGAWNALTAQGDIEQIRAAADFGIAAAKNANRLAFLCAIGIALIGYAILASRSWTLTFAGGAAIAGLVATVFLSASRSGLLNLGLLGVLLASRVRLREPRHVAVAGVIGVAALGAFLVMPDAYRERITNFSVADRSEEGGGSLAKRAGMVGIGFRMFLDSPLLGAGIGKFQWLSVVQYGSTLATTVHNSYLLALSEGGLVLLAPYLALFARLWIDLRRLQRRAADGREPRLEWLVGATRAMLLLFLVFTFFADLWHEIYLYLIAGMAAVLIRLYEAPRTVS